MRLPPEPHVTPPDSSALNQRVRAARRWIDARALGCVTRTGEMRHPGRTNAWIQTRAMLGSKAPIWEIACVGVLAAPSAVGSVTVRPPSGDPGILWA